MTEILSAPPVFERDVPAPAAKGVPARRRQPGPRARLLRSASRSLGARVGRAGRRVVPALPIAAAAMFVVVLTHMYLGAATVYLTPDAAHYLADADALTGQGVRELRHAPLFPAVLALVREMITEPLLAFRVAILAVLAGLVASLYVMARRWAAPAPALLAAVLGALLPVTGELMGWCGGSTLVGVATLALAVAAMESWIGGHRRGAVLTGTALGLVALSHPFLLAVGVWVLSVRWVAHLSQERRLNLGRGALGIAGLATAFALFGALLALAVPVYLRLEGGGGFVLQAPKVASLTGLLSWSVGDSMLVVGLFVAAVVAAFTLPSPGPTAVVTALGILTLFMGTSLSGSADYISRIAYTFPVAVAAGTAAAAELLRGRVAGAFARLPRPRITGAIVIVSLVGGLGVSVYGARVERSASFYQFLEPQDVPAIQQLSERSGVVATSWKSNNYGTGVSTSWYVEGLARRLAFGPTTPAMTMIPEQLTKGRDMQRLFAGDAGLENGALQVSTGPLGVRADPALAVSSEGAFYPYMYSDALVNHYPVAQRPDAERRIDGDTLVVSHHDPDGDLAMQQEVRLDGDRIEISYRLGDSYDGGDWKIHLWPSYGFPWSDVTQSAVSVSGVNNLPEEDVAFTVHAPGSKVAYVERDRRFGMQAIQISASDRDEVTIVIDVDTAVTAAPVTSFAQDQLLEEHDVRDVLMWKDTGWRARFDSDRCYDLATETETMLIYQVDAEGCRPQRAMVVRP